MKICDPHVHLFVDDERRKRYLVDDLSADLADGHAVVSAVYVEAANGFRAAGPDELKPVGETEWVVQLDPDGVLAAIVGYADLRLGDAIEEVLVAHVEAGGGRFRGLRARTNWDASPEVPTSRFAAGPRLLDDPHVGRAVSVLGRLGLTLDVFVYFHQLEEVARLAAAHPDVSIVVDHFGTPLAIGPYAGRREETLADLRRGLERLARAENVRLKLGGLGWPGFGYGWETRSEPPEADEVAEAWGPLERWCIETFGPDRAMCESNYPSDRPSLPYRTIWDAHELMTEELSEAERAAVLHDTAARFYRIDHQSRPPLTKITSPVT